MLSEGVIPVDRPTVPNALTISNSASIKGTVGSIAVIRYEPVTITPSAISVITAALRKASRGTEYRKAFSEVLVADDLMPCISAKNVVVFIPPPVDPGDAPINISIIIANNPADEKEESEQVEKPAVRAETLINSALSQEIFSVALKRSVPAAIKAALKESTTFVCMENFFQRKRVENISRITRKPIPPKKISAHVTRFKRTSLR